MLPLRTLFQVGHDSPHYNERNKQSIFYAQSWALMHYLVIGKSGRVDQLGKFMELIASNVPMEQAFQQAFEMTFEAMEKELRNYVKQSRYNVLSGHFQQKLETDTGMESAPISEAEAQAYLGDLLLHSRRKDSEIYLLKALKLDPNLAMAHASLGMLRFYEGKIDEARASLERAVQGNSQNYLIHYYYAYILSRGEGPDGTVTSYSKETAEKIHQHLQKAISLRPDYPQTYSLLGFVSLVTGERIEESLRLLKQAVAASPGRSDLHFIMAQLYLRTSDYKSARQFLEQVTKSNAELEVRQRAQTLLTQVIAFQERVEQPNTRSTVEPVNNETEKPELNVNASTTTPAPQPASDPSAYLREVLRPVAEGETQLQGTLLRIECEGKLIVFLVKVGDQTLRLRAGSFDDVEITTYNPEVKGDITCGPRKMEESVVVCFKPITDKRLKADGTIASLEFVPKDFRLK
jgi:tetratricopeptide (TPR) repeat protein